MQVYRVQFDKQGLAAKCHFPFLYRKVRDPHPPSLLLQQQQP